MCLVESMLKNDFGSNTNNSADQGISFVLFLYFGLLSSHVELKYDNIITAGGADQERTYH